ncbi:hypothetical protein JCM8208_002789 [Rhodotorula glutinis]
MSNPAHKYAPFDPDHPDGSDGGSDASIVMRTGANKAALKDLERAVFAGKKAIWPLFFATLVVGVGTSVWGLLKEKGDLRNVFIVILIGWGVLFGIEGFMLNELSTVRRSHHPMIVLRLCFIFGGWFTGYLVATCVLIGIWMYKGRFEGSHKLAWALLIIQGLLCAAVIVAFVLYVQLYSRKIKKLQMQATLVTPGTTQQLASAVGSMRRKVSRLSQRSNKSSSSSRRDKDGSAPSRRSSRASTLVGTRSVRSKASKPSSSQVPSDSGTDTGDGYSDDGRGKAGKGGGSGKGGEDGYSSGAGSTTASDDDTLLGAHDQRSSYGAQARAPSSTLSRSASAASASSYSSSRAHDGPTTSSGAPIPASLLIGSPASSPSNSRPTSPVYRSTSTASSASTRPGTIPVLVRGLSGTTRPASTSMNPYLARAPSSSTSPYPYQRQSTSAYSAAPPSTSYIAYSPSSSPAPPDRASSSPYTRSSTQSRSPGASTRPPPSSSAPPPSTSRYSLPPSYPVGRSASTATARSAYPASAAGGAGRAQLAVTNPDALPYMPLHH